ncbi:bifunctional DNA primase/polymerase [Pseudohoeflea coraliihabitans]|uniref:AAA family ATPase n=1 Tax=Pseudohoeflea coraliihabitans TaxID=2860393 RepID=A0ABS6WJX5_9HYPH|nr:bifunctional DNA primase/polymerase [Pseudohoeflea sp. DP4N28-3]MBW3096242.1 AAA family ATPase [Pseudohoeflea sp. DP4N28-3]
MPNLDRIDGDLVSASKSKAACAWIKAGAKVVALHGVHENGQCTCGNRKCKSPGKHPIAAEFPNGHHSATRARGKIIRALKAFPDANIGVVLPDNIVVLDVDGPEGRDTFDKLNLPRTATVQTGRGTHHYFRTTAALPERKQRLAGIDFKDSRSGYLVAPPSRHHSGQRYRRKRGSTPKMAALPQSFISALVAKPSATANFNQTNTITKGGRNSTLASYAGYFRYKGLGSTALERVLGALNREICSPPLDDNELSHIAHSIGNYEAGFENAFGSLADVEEEDVQFLAHPYIVKGATTVLDGNMGQGKSTFTAALAAAVTTGRPPPFLETIEQGSVLFLSAEDDPARVLKPRLVENGADVSKVRYQEQVFSLDANGMMMLRQEIETHRPALVVIDPIIAYMDAGVDGNKANDTMRFMVELDLIAREYDVSILIVRHLRKARADNAMHQGIGSIAVSARVRSGLILGLHPHDPSKRAIAHSKANYSEKGPTIVFELRSGEKTRPPVVKWHEVDPDISEDDLLAKPPGALGRPSEERDFAKEFLREALSKGPLEKARLDQMASARAITPETLRRAADDMNIVKQRGQKGRSVWSLP